MMRVSVGRIAAAVYLLLKEGGSMAYIIRGGAMHDSVVVGRMS